MVKQGKYNKTSSMNDKEYESGIKIKEKVICGLCWEEIKYDDLLGYYCDNCGLTVIIKK